MPSGPITSRRCEASANENIDALPSGKTRRLEVFNLHLGLSARERERQVALLARSREFASLPFGVPTIVAGDYNDWRSLLRPLFVDMLGFRSATGGNVEGERPIKTPDYEQRHYCACQHGCHRRNLRQ